MNAVLALVPQNGEGQQENIDDGKLTLAKLKARARQLGQAEGKGSNSRPGLFLTIVEGAMQRAVTKDDVPGLYDEYAKASAAACGIGYQQHPSRPAQISKMVVAVRLGELPSINGMALMNKVIDVQKAQKSANDGKLDFPPLDGMTKVARCQINDQPNTMLADDVIRGLLIRPATETPEEADRLDRVKKAVDGLRDATKEPVSQESKDLLNRLSGELHGRIVALGGTSYQRRRREKAEQELAELNKLGQTEALRLAAVPAIEVSEAHVPNDGITV